MSLNLVRSEKVCAAKRCYHGTGVANSLWYPENKSLGSKDREHRLS
jgi:hypothetical protein